MADKKIIRLVFGSTYDVEVRGESHYQRALEQICRGRKSAEDALFSKAMLIPEPNNRADKNAVRVEIDGQQVGYLSRDLAAEFRSAAAASKFTGIVETRAKVVGGFKLRNGETASYGVRLDLPEDLAYEIAEATGTPLNANAQNAPAKKQGGGCLRWVLIGLGVLVAMAIIGALIGGQNPSTLLPAVETGRFMIPQFSVLI